MDSTFQECGCAPVDVGPSVLNSQFCSGFSMFMMMLQFYIRQTCDISTPCGRVMSVKQTETEYDFIVVGGGTAGSMVAARLSEEKKFKVLLLEAGGQEPTEARIPSFYRAFWSNKDVDWSYRTVPENYCLDQNGQGCMWPRGKVLGGSNVLNGMMYHRGHEADYEDWVEAGAKGWSWEENMPYFERTEGNKQIGTVVSGAYHSSNGTLPVERFEYQPFALTQLMKAIEEAGLPVIEDMNDPETPDGFNIAQTMSEDGQRVTTARAYLEPRSKHPNLSVMLHAHVSKVLIKNHTAVGVEYIDQKGNIKVVRAAKEVILSAGALNTPQILMLSGIGPKDSLERLKIPVKADLPVGKNLRNHVGVTLYFVLSKLENTQDLDWKALVQYIKHRNGPMSSTGITQLTGILYSSLADRERRQPDIQFFFNGFWAECSKTGLADEPVGDCPQAGRNITANAALLLPRSVGIITLNSTDPLDPPLFYPNYFYHPEDMVMLKDGINYLKRIFESDILQNKYGIILDPNAGCKEKTPWSDDWMECMARVHTDPQNHQLGTAAIGSVLDPELKVRHIEGLRVADASAMPTQPTGNPQGAIMLVAERAADFIRTQWK